MKIYDRKHFLATLLISIPIIIFFTCYFVISHNVISICWIILGLIYLKRGLSASVTEKGFLAAQERDINIRRVYKKLFGKMACVAPYGTLFFLLLSLFTCYLFHSANFLSYMFLLVALVYQLWLTIKVSREIGNDVNS